MSDPESTPGRGFVLMNLVARLLSEHRPLCVSCLSAKSGLRIGEVIATVKSLELTMAVERDTPGAAKLASS
jgi:hypothetical protein